MDEVWFYQFQLIKNIITYNLSVISTNLEAVTAQYVDVRLERKKSVLDVYHKALHPPKGDGEKKQGDGGKEEKLKKKSSDIEL